MYLLLTEKRFDIDEMEKQKTTMTPGPGIMALDGMSGVQEPLAHPLSDWRVYSYKKKKEKKQNRVNTFVLST